VPRSQSLLALHQAAGFHEGQQPSLRIPVIVISHSGRR